MSPKSLLRNPAAVSSLQELAAGAFHPILADPADPEPRAVRQVLLCSGKVYYELAEARAAQRKTDTAILRLEQLYPLRESEVREALSRYPAGGAGGLGPGGAAQHGRLGLHSRRARPGACRGSTWWRGRPAPALPSGSATRHRLVQQALIQEALG